MLESFPDFILVDGRFRVACMLEAARRTREGGHRVTMMCDDYVKRRRYHRIETYLGKPRTFGRVAFWEIAPSADYPAITPEIVHAALKDWW